MSNNLELSPTNDNLELSPMNDNLNDNLELSPLNKFMIELKTFCKDLTQVVKKHRIKT